MVKTAQSSVRRTNDFAEAKAWFSPKGLAGSESYLAVFLDDEAQCLRMIHVEAGDTGLPEQLLLTEAAELCASAILLARDDTGDDRGAHKSNLHVAQFARVASASGVSVLNPLDAQTAR